jgi:hypothetical protein
MVESSLPTGRQVGRFSFCHSCESRNPEIPTVNSDNFAEIKS